MIDQLIKLVKQNADDEVINNQAIPNEKNDVVIKEIAENISGGLKEQAGKGNMDSLMDMFKSGNVSSLTNNNAVAEIIAKTASNLASKFGISPQTAQQITSALLPKVMSQFVNKTNDPNDKEFDLQDIVKSIGGGNAGDLLGKLGGGSLGKMFGN